MATLLLLELLILNYQSFLMYTYSKQKFLSNYQRWWWWWWSIFSKYSKIVHGKHCLHFGFKMPICRLIESTFLKELSLMVVIEFLVQLVLSELLWPRFQELKRMLIKFISKLQKSLELCQAYQSWARCLLSCTHYKTRAGSSTGKVSFFLAIWFFATFKLHNN